MSAILRFAPSPTGKIHIGNLRTAMLNWLYARQTGGKFILRLDDTDAQRSTEAYAEGIRKDLKWLGIEWDREERQSARYDRYAAVVAQLKAAGRLYPCYESEDDLEKKRRRQRARGRPPVYDRSALLLSDAEKADLEAAGKRPHWRFLLDASARDSFMDSARNGGTAAQSAHPVAHPVEWTDLVRGDQSIDLDTLSDPVLIREDGSYLYTLCSVIDDIDFGITHIMRGEDHVTNSAVQVEIFRALKAVPPAFAHHSLLVGADGQGLSKRLGSLSIESFREMGLDPLAVACHAALIGTSDPLQPHLALDDLVELFEFSKLSRAPGRFDPDELKLLNSKLLQQMPYDLAAPRLAEVGAALVGGSIDAEAFWLAVRGNLAVIGDAKDWWEVITGDITPVIEDQDLCAKAAILLPPEPWDDMTWGTWTAAVKKASGKKGRALFHPLRLALTGRNNGPELKAMLPLIGRAQALQRLGD